MNINDSGVPIIGQTQPKVSVLRDADLDDDLVISIELNKEDILKFLDLMQIAFSDLLAESIQMLFREVVWTANEQAAYQSGDDKVILSVINRLATSDQHTNIPSVFVMKLWMEVTDKIKSKKISESGETGETRKP